MMHSSRLALVLVFLLVSSLSALSLPENNPNERLKIPKVLTEPTFLLSLTVLMPTVAFAGDIDRGTELFNNNCASCHAGGGNVMKEKKTLRKEALEKFVGIEPENVLKFVTSSGQHQRLFFPKVPGGKLTETDYADAVTYIVDQATGDKW